MSTRRVAVVDLGSNSTRLLIADVGGDGAIAEVVRRSTVTRLGQDVDTTGTLHPDAVERVLRALAEYRRLIDEHGGPPAAGVLTSAVRDASNGAELTRAVRERFGIAARTIPGEEEARLTYLGAVSERASTAPTAVIDVGGGSTEVIVGAADDVRFHVSTQVGVVRHSERHLRDDPPVAGQLEALRADVARTFAQQITPAEPPREGVAVAGTATQSAAMLAAPVLRAVPLEGLLDRLAAMDLERRRNMPGLDPDRAPTIIAGLAILLEAMKALQLDAVEASDHDILRGVALEHERFRAAAGIPTSGD